MIPTRYEPPPETTWCTDCQVHRATVEEPICPVCVPTKESE